jgi:hypothetical protein
VKGGDISYLRVLSVLSPAQCGDTIEKTFRVLKRNRKSGEDDRSWKALEENIYRKSMDEAFGRPIEVEAR